MNMSNSKSAITFEQDAQLVIQLLKELQNEQAALIVSDIDAIEAIIDSRLVLLQQLSVAAKYRYDALAAHGFEPNENGMAKWLKVQGKPTLNKAWQTFQKSLVQAKEMNRLNGILISKHLNRNQQVLGQLQSNNQQAEVYGKNGQSKSQSYLRNPLSA